MLNYNEFQRAVAFMRAHGIEPKLDMLSLESPKWYTLLELVAEWEKEVESHKQYEPTKEELEMERLQESEKNLYHSS